ncbi:hypothetical protein GNF10_29965 [Nostoc sp. UCD121]|uniref:hypothetical protein n=1 Tax=unclassified Nostoc TaxID=2593658 RepID=UPI0016286C94|nr:MULTISPECIES: hypothetical protein [unclassified Nostoc]MBC1220967.1 hypothetical protein [Nostoc sp. UCD120]MBC1280061.1 hypothetical protein [Nostoc sp. UCD121]MBC1296414.1 hypothetical protein [Nostoc sp. UCD122]
MTKPSSNRKKATSAVSNNLQATASSAEDTFDPENPATATITVTAAEVEELSETEQRDRLHLERRVERAFFEAGKALAQLRDRRLYRSTHKTFEEYCRSRFAYTHRHVNYLIAASNVVDNIIMGTNGSQNEIPDESSQNEISDEMGTNGSQILPTTERQVRPLTKLEPSQQQEVWRQAVEQAGGKVPPARIVKDVVQRIMERTKVPNTYQIGEVCQILAKDNPELRGKGGCWGIVNHVGEFSCTVKLWDSKYTVGLQYLKSYNYLPAECEQMQVICDRISRVYSDLLEETVKSLLQALGKVNRPYLTAVEEKLLKVLESEIRE